MPQFGQLGVDPEKRSADASASPTTDRTAAGTARNTGGGSGAPVTRLVGLRSKGLIGCAAGNKHSVVFSATDVFTFGTNIGQLGHPRTEAVVTVPR